MHRGESQTRTERSRCACVWSGTPRVLVLALIDLAAWAQKVFARCYNWTRPVFAVMYDPVTFVSG